MLSLRFGIGRTAVGGRTRTAFARRGTTGAGQGRRKGPLGQRRTTRGIEDFCPGRPYGDSFPFPCTILAAVSPTSLLSPDAVVEREHFGPGVRFGRLLLAGFLFGPNELSGFTPVAHKTMNTPAQNSTVDPSTAIHSDGPRRRARRLREGKELSSAKSEGSSSGGGTPERRAARSMTSGIWNCPMQPGQVTTISDRLPSLATRVRQCGHSTMLHAGTPGPRIAGGILDMLPHSSSDFEDAALARSCFRPATR